MKLKIFFISLLNLLVALAVNPANASPNDKLKYLKLSEEAFKKGDFYKSDYLVAKYLGDEYANQVKALEIISKRNLKPTSLIDGSYSDEFLRFFFGRSLTQWGSMISDRDNNILVKMNSNKSQYVSIWGKPYIEMWYILAKDKKRQHSYTVGMYQAEIRIGPLNEDKKPLKMCDSFTVDGPIQYFYEPMFLDTNNDGKNELLLKYNLTVADGYIQVLDIFVPIIKDNYCHLSHRQSFYGRNGFAYYQDERIYVSEQTSDIGESVLGSSLQTETLYNPYGKLIDKRIIPNFLKTKNIDYLQPHYSLHNKIFDNMYYASLLSCKIRKTKVASNCEEILDSRGPYINKKECNLRVQEMKKIFHNLKDISIWEIKGYLCDKRGVYIVTDYLN